MQSSYGGVSEIQQFMVESCGAGAPSLFASTAADIHSAVAGGSNPLKYQAPLPPQAAALPPHFAHFHSIPITQQLFQQPPPPAAHQFQLFHPHHHQLNYQPLEPRRLQIPHHQLGLDQDSGPENSASSARVNIPTASGGGGGPPSFLAEAMNFKLAVNESSGGGSREVINDEDGILRGGDDDGSESRLHHWQRDEESSIKELSWRPLDLDIDYINRNNKRCKNKEPESSINGAGKVSKKNKEEVGTRSSNYKIFSELEAIYKPGGSGGGVGGINQTGSGSALTGDETPLLHAAAMAPPELAAAADCVGGMSETSAGEDAGRPGKKFSNNSSSSGRRRRKGRRWQRQLSSMATFFENLVKQLMDHQEGLHRKFLEAMESREQERTCREEAWRKQEAAKSCREAAARASERKLASSREAAIIAFLEKITGESLNLPPKPQFSDENNNNSNNNNHNHLQIEPYNEEAFGDQESNKVQFNTSRWPKTEVQALIRVRSELESQFQEPGLKGPLWEEVSATMAAMGYLRSAKRCKEKWENINKYFRKTKESGKKRPQHSKTCPYFQQLDQLYSTAKSSHNKDDIPKEQRPIEESDSEKKHDDDTTEGKLNDNSELLDAIVVPPASTDYRSLKFGFDFNGKVVDENTEPGGAAPNTDRNGEQNEEDEEQGGEEEEEAAAAAAAEGDQEGEAEGEEGEGENQEHRTQHQLDQEVDELHDTSLFFQRLQS